MFAHVIIIFVFTVFLAWEFYAPRLVNIEFEQRWPRNYALGLFVFSFGYAASFLSINAVAVFKFATVDIFYYFPAFLKSTLAFLILDFIFYWLHRIAHFFNVLWRFHCVHHSDTSFDVSTNFRHHPIEYLWVFVLIFLLTNLIYFNAQVLAIYGLVATIVQMWHHSNIRMPAQVERVIGAIIITPSIHVIHHSMQYLESNRNFGTLFTVWDKIFGTYQAPNYEKGAGPVGVKGLTDESHQSLKALLIQPFK